MNWSLRFVDGKMEDELLNIIIKNIESFQSSVTHFVANNTKLLNLVESVPGSNRSVPVPHAYRNYVASLLDMIANTTDFVKDMMLKARNTISVHANNNAEKPDECETLSDISSTVSESTVTGYENGFSFVPMEHKSISNECNNSQFVEDEVCIMPPNLPFGMIDTSKFKSGDIIHKAFVSSIELDKLQFHIVLSNLNYGNVLSKLYKTEDRMHYNNPPLSGVIFGMKIDGEIVRAMRCLPVSSGKVFLMDYGDIVKVDMTLQNIFQLTEEERNIPAQAIMCKFHCTREADEMEIANNRDRLKKLLYNSVSFCVVENKNGILHLMVQSDIESKEEQLPPNDKIAAPQRTNSHENVSHKRNKNELTEEELEMFYEEPMCTSNALMAVAGYVPKDNQRICRFYDEKIDGCFKGNNCRQLHVPLRNDHITKDVGFANAFAEPKVSIGTTILYKPDDILKILVTHVKDLEYFYGTILNDSNPPDQLGFSDRDVKPSDYLKKLPFAHDIVLAKFNADGQWYRAKVTDVDDYRKTAKVFYMDYGNRQIVPLKNLARCTEIVAKIPPQAQQFRLADVSKISDSENEETFKRGMGLLWDMIAEKELKLKVVNHCEDLLVRFLEEPYSEIPQLLAEMNCVKLMEQLPV